MKRIILPLLIALFSAGNSLPAQETSRFDPVRQFIAESVSHKKTAGGSVLVYYKGEQVFGTGFGHANIEVMRPYEVDTPSVVASISKPILGTTLYRLVDDGKLDIEEPISEYLPEFADRTLESGKSVERAPTVTELLTHISGLRPDAAKGGRIWFASWVKGQTLEFAVNKLAKEYPFVAQPGSKYGYSGIGTDVAARVGEVISGMPRNEMVVTYFSKPLGMNNTFYADEEAIAARGIVMPIRYVFDADSGQIKRRTRQTKTPAKGKYSPSGGSIISTAPDLAKWLLMIRSGGNLPSGEVFLSEKAMEEMLLKKRGSYNCQGGLFLRRRDTQGQPAKYSHTGSTGTKVWIDVEHDIIGIILTQNPSEFNKELERRIFATLVPEESSTD